MCATDLGLDEFDCRGACGLAFACRLNCKHAPVLRARDESTVCFVGRERNDRAARTRRDVDEFADEPRRNRDRASDVRDFAWRATETFDNSVAPRTFAEARKNRRRHRCRTPRATCLPRRIAHDARAGAIRLGPLDHRAEAGRTAFVACIDDEFVHPCGKRAEIHFTRLLPITCLHERLSVERNRRTVVDTDHKPRGLHAFWNTEAPREDHCVFGLRSCRRIAWCPNPCWRWKRGGLRRARCICCGRARFGRRLRRRGRRSHVLWSRCIERTLHILTRTGKRLRLFARPRNHG